MKIGDMFQRISNSKWSLTIDTFKLSVIIFYQNFNLLVLIHTCLLPIPVPILTNLSLSLNSDIYPSGLHLVSVAGKVDGMPTHARYSIAYFVYPTPDGTIEPKPLLVAAVGKKHYELITFQIFSAQMFDTTNIYD
ncbi:hypothetical protein DM02DRAFT_653003 [Periconia macrospinosa]|uniref:Uncharacterized protein n=1 Tax=Periconia macrospinosa TaxID=97972 RepID=A0A2V1E068_9PLEO|nr:hypothetical protein DM02DRAFT_653003 [Periconia macrospinosa]